MTTEVNILFSHIYHLCALIQPVNLIIFFYISFMKQRIIELETEVRLLRAEIKAVKDEKDREIKVLQDENKGLLVEKTELKKDLVELKKDLVRSLYNYTRLFLHLSDD